MSQTAEVTETAVTAMSLLKTEEAVFDFPSDKTSTRQVLYALTPPLGAEVALIALQGFAVGYTDTDYELQNLQISLSTTTTIATCTGTLRDKNNNGQAWNGKVIGRVTYFGNA